MAAKSASKTPVDHRAPVADANFLGRFIYDVLHYTLPKCGFRKVFHLMNIAENAYKRPNFVRIASASTLRVCFVMRDAWRRKLLSQPRDRGKTYNIQNIATFMTQIVIMATGEGKRALQFHIETTLALCVEMVLLFDSENMEFDFMNVIGSAVSNIMCLVRPPVVWQMYFRAPPPKYREAVEELFQEFDNIWEYTRWLEDFAEKFAVPYGSRRNLTKLFHREVKKRWKEIIEKECPEGKPQVEKVRIHLGFLPQEVYDEIVAETPVPMPSYSEVSPTYSEATTPSASSEKGAVGGKQSHRRRSTGSGSDSGKTSQGKKSTADQTSKGEKSPSGQTSQGAQSGKGSSEQGIEDDLSRMNLGADGGSQKSKGAVAKRKDSKKK